MLTETQTALAIAYLRDLGATYPTETAPASWADYINHEYPTATPADLEQATRAAAKQWHKAGARGTVTAMHIADHIGQIRSTRVSTALAGRYLTAPDHLATDGKTELTWRATAITAMAEGATYAEAVQIASELTERKN